MFFGEEFAQVIKGHGVGAARLISTRLTLQKNAVLEAGHLAADLL